MSQYTPLSKQFNLQMFTVSLERFKASGLGAPQYWTPTNIPLRCLAVAWSHRDPAAMVHPFTHSRVQRGRYWGVPWMAAELVSLGNWDSSSRARGRVSSLGQGEGVGQAFPRECLLGAGPAFPCKLIKDLKQ